LSCLKKSCALLNEVLPTFPKTQQLIDLARVALLTFALFAGLNTAFADSPKPASPVSKTPAGLTIPLRFEPCSPINCGDSPDWKYIGIQGSHAVLVAPGKIAFVRPDPATHRPLTTALEIAGAASGFTAVPGKRLTSEASYFRGSDPKQWRSHVPDYDSVRLHGVYPGIDLRFYQSDASQEFDILAQPEACQILSHVRYPSRSS